MESQGARKKQNFLPAAGGWPLLTTGGGPGEIRILLRALDDACFELSVADNGIGLPEGYEGRGTLGLTLVRLLTEQLDGTLDISTENGTSCRLRFPKKVGS